MSYERSSRDRKQERAFKIVVIGDSSVGKTCLTFRYCDGTFPKTEATIGLDFREKSLNIDGESIRMRLWDTAGEEKYRLGIVSQYYRGAHGVLFVYDVTSMKSFNNLPAWIKEFKEHQRNDSDAVMILVGNKCDCKSERAVSTTMAQRFADSQNMPLFETSAADEKETDTINAIFNTLAHKLKNQQPFVHKSLDTIHVNRTPSPTPTENSGSWCC